MFGWFKSNKKKKYVGLQKFTVWYRDEFGNKKWPIEEKELPVYQEYNTETGEVYSVYLIDHGRKFYFNVDVFIHENRLIRL